MKLLAIATALAAGASVLAIPAAEARPKLTGEQRLAKMLEGREAGTPVDCIPYLRTRSDVTVIDKTALVYRVGSTLYVNRPDNVDRLTNDDVLLTKTSASRLCSVDTVELYGLSIGRTWKGFLGLNDFVPYRKVKQAAR